MVHGKVCPLGLVVLTLPASFSTDVFHLEKSWIGADVSSDMRHLVLMSKLGYDDRQSLHHSYRRDGNSQAYPTRSLGQSACLQASLVPPADSLHAKSRKVHGRLPSGSIEIL